MSGSINKVTLMGNVGRMPCWTALPSGAPVCNLVLATDDIEEDWRTGESKIVTHWHRIVLTGALAQSMRKRIAKGDTLFVEGRMQTRKWTDRAGAVKYTTEVIAATAQVYPKPLRSAQPERQGCVRFADAEIAAWIADYDAADARIRAEQAVLVPPRRKGGIQVRRLAT